MNLLNAAAAASSTATTATPVTVMPSGQVILAQPLTATTNTALMPVNASNNTPSTTTMTTLKLTNMQPTGEAIKKEPKQQANIQLQNKRNSNYFTLNFL